MIIKFLIKLIRFFLISLEGCIFNHILNSSQKSFIGRQNGLKFGVRERECMVNQEYLRLENRLINNQPMNNKFLNLLITDIFLLLNCRESGHTCLNRIFPPPIYNRAIRPTRCLWRQLRLTSVGSHGILWIRISSKAKVIKASLGQMAILMTFLRFYYITINKYFK